MAEDLTCELVASGKYSVIPASQVQRGLEQTRESGPQRPLLRCYESVAQSTGARYLALCWFDDFESTVRTKDIVGSEAVVRIRGHYAVRDLTAGATLLKEKFDFGSSKTELVGDVAERYLIAVENVAQQVVASMSEDIAGTSPAEVKEG